jgi:hypothetical protein
MRTLILTISFVLFTLVTSFSQWRATDRPNNDKIINYILKGKYLKVIKLTKSAHFNRVSFLDTNSASFLSYSRETNTLYQLSDSLFIQYMSRLQTFINSSTISDALDNPKDLDIKISTDSYSDEKFVGQNNKSTIYTSRIYIINNQNFTYSLIITFNNLKIKSITIQIEKI